MFFSLLPLPAIHFGAGRFSSLPELAAAFGTEVLLVTGRHALAQSGRLTSLIDALHERGMHVSHLIVDREPSPELVDDAVIKAAASVAAGTTFGIDVTTGGSVAANSAGRQVLGAVSVAPSATTVVKTATLTNGSPVIVVADASGWFPGAAITGTGVSGTVSSIDYDNRRVTLSANATAGGPSSVTATYTGFIVGQISRPVLQGAIT